MQRAEHWLIRESRKVLAAARDPLTWIMLITVLFSMGLMLWFLLKASNNFGAFYAMPYACSAGFGQMRLFVLTMLTPLFFVAVLVTVAELSVVLGLRKKKRGKVDYRFLLTVVVSMVVLGLISVTLLNC